MSPARGTVAAAAAASLLAASTAGCGGDGPLSHGEFVKQAGHVCAAYDASVRVLTKPKTFAQITAYVDKTLPLYEAALKRLSALRPPTRDEQTVAEWLAADRQIAATLRQLRSAAVRHDLAAASAAADRIQAESATSRDAASSLGLDACSAP